MERKKKIPIGIERYKEIVDKNYYYIDKTLLIRDLLDKGGAVNLFTRPRRFGKTLTLSMLRAFFEKDTDLSGNVTDNRHYFAGTKIAEAGEDYTSHMGKYPVISMSLKSAKQPDFEMAYASLVDEIAREYKRHRYVLESDRITEDDKEAYRLIMGRKADRISYAKALVFLSDCLEAYHGTKVIILLDEYDVPLENAFFCGFYDKMIGFIRSLFESALKTNDNLEFAVITGCLRISKESIFTGLNNLEIISILNLNYAEYFGFVPSEVEQMLADYGLSVKTEEVKRWYDGYLFGNTEVYNPWSVINYVKNGIASIDSFPKPYWSNTSSNSIIRELVERADDTVKEELEHLIDGGTIEKQIHEDITYEEIYKTQDNLWNFLFFTGYLKKISERYEERKLYLTLAIPNEEVTYVYENTIKEWFEERLKKMDTAPIQQAILNGDCETAETILRNHLMESISYYDNQESFYHGYLTGMLVNFPEYVLRSNREAGNGRPDIQLVSYDLKKTAIMIEIKKSKDYAEMEEQCQQALQQIKERNYKAELELEGYSSFLYYGVCFCKKSCKIRMEKDGL